MRFLNIQSRWKWWLFIAATATWLLWMTLRPDGNPHRTELNLIPMAEHGPAIACLVNPHCFFRRSAWRFFMIDVVGNVIVFMPIGFGLAGALARDTLIQTIRPALLGGFLFSLTIELLQLAVPTRTTDIDDLIFNSLGTLLGVIAFILVMRKFNFRTANNR